MKITLIAISITIASTLGAQHTLHDQELFQLQIDVNNTRTAIEQQTEVLRQAEENRQFERNPPRQREFSATVDGTIQKQQQTEQAAQMERWRIEGNAQAAQFNAQARPTPAPQDDLTHQHDESMQLALRIYPDIDNTESQMLVLMEQLDNHWLKIRHPLYSEPSKPLILAEICALKLKIKPRL